MLELKLAQPENFQSSYAYYFAVMAKQAYAVPTIPDTNPTFRHTVALHFRLAGTEELLTGNGEIEQKNEEIAASLGRLKALNNPTAKQHWATCSKAKEEVDRRFAEVHQMQEELLAEFKQLAPALQEKLRAILVALDKQLARENSKEIQDMLRSVSTGVAGLQAKARLLVTRRSELLPMVQELAETSQRALAAAQPATATQATTQPTPPHS